MVLNGITWLWEISRVHLESHSEEHFQLHSCQINQEKNISLIPEHSRDANCWIKRVVPCLNPLYLAEYINGLTQQMNTTGTIVSL
jgi:hypothetical protein